jgi:regulator of protease activity HflC (stomatin/prohibitin superfamily)
MVVVIVVLVILAAIALVLLFVLGLALVRDNQVGILTRKMTGKPLLPGQIIARNQEIGVLAETLRPGLYWRFPIFWKIEKVPVTEIGTDEVGVVESVDGEPLPTGRLLGDAIECDSYQDAKRFLEGGGKKGPQVDILRPGVYRINTAVFTIKKHPVTSIEAGGVGIAVALDGISLPPGYIIAPKPLEHVTESRPKVRTHRFFQDGQAFLDSGGYRGPQLDTLQPGEYYVNPLLFEVKRQPVADVPPGYVAVLRSNVGEELETDSATPPTLPSLPDLRQPLHEAVERLLITDRERRGILRDPIAPGIYNLNTIAYTAYLVPTSAVTIDWATGAQVRMDRNLPVPSEPTPQAGGKAAEFFKFAQLRVTSKDGFQLDVDVRMIIRIRPEHAPFVIARFGSVENLIEQIVHPLVDSSFRNRAGEEKAIAFVQGRSELQQQALTRAREEFQQYFVEAQNLLIAYIAVDKSLLDTQTKKEIAIQQQTQYQQEARAELERISVQEQKARADKQVDVIAAKLSIDIAADRAEAARREAEGVRDSTKIRAEGDAEAVRRVGQATADAYAAQATVVGPERLAVLKVLEEVSTGQVKITPDVMVSGGDGGPGGGLFNAWLATTLGPKVAPPEKTEKNGGE